MQKTEVRNLTTLTDFAAVFRAALYLSGDAEQAKADGYKIHYRERLGRRILTITEEEAGNGKKNPE